MVGTLGAFQGLALLVPRLKAGLGGLERVGPEHCVVRLVDGLCLVEEVNDGCCEAEQRDAGSEMRSKRRERRLSAPMCRRPDTSTGRKGNRAA